MIKKLVFLLFVTLQMPILVGCGGQNTGSEVDNIIGSKIEESPIPEESSGYQTNTETNSDKIGDTSELEVRFGYEGESFILHLEENDTAAEIARNVGEAEWNLPIYHYDDYENYEVMQYYDLPSRYVIPSAPESVNTQKAGEVYYSHPNRILLFYQDGGVKGEYTKVGYFDYTDTLREAVENNPVIEGWGKNIVSISLAQ